MRPQEEIKLIMLKHNITYAWIAKNIGTYPQRIQYYVELSSGDNNLLYNQIMMLFEKHGYISDSFAKCENLIELNLRSNSKIGEELKRLNDQVLSSISDKKFTHEERVCLRRRLQNMMAEFNEIFNKLISITEG